MTRYVHEDWGNARKCLLRPLDARIARGNGDQSFFCCHCACLLDICFQIGEMTRSKEEQTCKLSRCWRSTIFVHSDVGTSFEPKKQSVLLFMISLLLLQGRDFYAFTMPHENTIQAGGFSRAKSTVIFHVKHCKNTQVVTHIFRILVVPLPLLVPPADFVSLSVFKCMFE